MKDDKEPQSGNPLVKNAAIWLGVILAIVLFVSLFEGSSKSGADRAGTGFFVVQPRSVRRVCVRHRAPFQFFSRASYDERLVRGAVVASAI